MSGGRYACSDLGAPWNIRWRARTGAMYHFVSRGQAWLEVDGAPAVHLVRGDLVVLPHGEGHRLSADEHARSDAPVVDFASQATSTIVRRGGRGARTLLVCGELSLEAPAHPLLVSLPHLVHLRLGRSARARWISASLALLASEAHADALGARTIAARLAEVIFIEAVRHALDRPGHARGVLAGLSDPLLRGALLAMHDAPAQSPRVEVLAKRSGLSRSLFAERFHRLVGEPPIAYLTRLRMTHAARLLRQPDRSVADVAADVGYASVAAFTRAFQRVMGETPASYRRGSSASR